LNLLGYQKASNFRVICWLLKLYFPYDKRDIFVQNAS
jgi:hypothetical protein